MWGHLLVLAVGAAGGALGVLLVWLWQAQRRTAVPWRTVLAVLPLPMLALAASYGVYSFALLFVPQWVAVVQAAAFELTYIGLAVLIGLDRAQRARAGAISIGAVAVSILYNSLAGLFHRRPELLAAGADAWGIAADVLLSIAHGLPLALVAYFVADLLLHRSHADARDAAALAQLLRTPPAPSEPAPHDAPALPAQVRTEVLEVRAPVAPAPAYAPAPAAHACKRCGAPVASPQAVAASARWGCANCKER